ncbi:MAG: hypothetical protein BGO37_07195 [Cellulomonas sp. 73-92]|uniref:hypothetical protein n=1 Tax=Cellulomonas sp. 73-92 TaxID=1895740 RepID=UPI000928477B|nr:hypothetical protein [Cellulomonas sp. 73-92]OJV78503.1 MAG: hypothetical protein BGO37_07195 [Cellulomonas sp. 73-92]
MSTAQHTQKDRRRRGVVVLKFSLAGAALLGIAAAATSAAWSDNAWFSASATAAKVTLTASVDGGAFVHTDQANPVPISYGLLNQGESVTKTLTLKNEGTVPLTINAQTLTVGTTGIFAGTPGGVTSDDPASVSVVGNTSLVNTVLAANGGTASIQILLTTPGDWSNTYQGETGTVTVSFGATS